MVTDRGNRWLLRALPLGVGAAACAVCCSVPLLAGLSFAGLAGVAAGAAERWSLAIVLALGAAVAGIVLWRRRAAQTGSPCIANVCSVDGSCGCRATSGSSDSARCTLDREQRSAQFRSLLSRSLIRSQRFDGGFTWTLRAGDDVEREVRALIEKESHFLEFDVHTKGAETQWRVTSFQRGREGLDLLYGATRGLLPLQADAHAT